MQRIESSTVSHDLDLEIQQNIPALQNSSEPSLPSPPELNRRANQRSLYLDTKSALSNVQNHLMLNKTVQMALKLLGIAASLFLLQYTIRKLIKISEEIDYAAYVDVYVKTAIPNTQQTCAEFPLITQDVCSEVVYTHLGEAGQFCIDIAQKLCAQEGAKEVHLVIPSILAIIAVLGVFGSAYAIYYQLCEAKNADFIDEEERVSLLGKSEKLSGVHIADKTRGSQFDAGVGRIKAALDETDKKVVFAAAKRDTKSKMYTFFQNGGKDVMPQIMSYVHSPR